MSDNFPDGVILKKYEGSRFTVGSDEFQLTKLISEKLDRRVDERIAVFESFRVRDRQEATVKFRVQYVSFLFPREWAGHKLRVSHPSRLDPVNYLRRG